MEAGDSGAHVWQVQQNEEAEQRAHQKGGGRGRDAVEGVEHDGRQGLAVHAQQGLKGNPRLEVVDARGQLRLIEGVGVQGEVYLFDGLGRLPEEVCGFLDQPGHDKGENGHQQRQKEEIDEHGGEPSGATRPRREPLNGVLEQKAENKGDEEEREQAAVHDHSSQSEKNAPDEDASVGKHELADVEGHDCSSPDSLERRGTAPPKTRSKANNP